MDFTWNGETASSHGVKVVELPPIQAAARRDTPYTVPYRSGNIHIQDGALEETVKRVSLYLPYEQGGNVEDIRAVMAWLQGNGEVIFSDEPDRMYKARILSGADYSPWVNGFEDRTVEVYFECEPFAYHTNVSDITITASGAQIVNTGTAEARPLYAVTGSGNVQIMVDGEMFELDGMDGTWYVDARDMECYALENGLRVSKNGKMSGGFPTISPGTKIISWIGVEDEESATGSVSRIVITPRWCDV